MKRLVIEMPDEMHTKLKHIAVAKNSSMKNIVLALIVMFLGKQEKKGK